MAGQHDQLGSMGEARELHDPVVGPNVRFNHYYDQGADHLTTEVDADFMMDPASSMSD